MRSTYSIINWPNKQITKSQGYLSLKRREQDKQNIESKVRINEQFQKCLQSCSTSFIPWNNRKITFKIFWITSRQTNPSFSLNENISTDDFNMEELENTIKHMTPDKAPGLPLNIWKLPNCKEVLLSFCNVTLNGNRPA